MVPPYRANIVRGVTPTRPTTLPPTTTGEVPKSLLVQSAGNWSGSSECSQSGDIFVDVVGPGPRPSEDVAVLHDHEQPRAWLKSGHQLGQ